jgi:hypothetical protein
MAQPHRHHVGVAGLLWACMYLSGIALCFTFVFYAYRFVGYVYHLVRP